MFLGVVAVDVGVESIKVVDDVTADEGCLASLGAASDAVFAWDDGGVGV